MKNEFLIAITQLAAEKNLPKEVVFEAVETALASAYKKDNLANSNVVVKIDPESGNTRVFTRRTVVEEVENPDAELTIDDAKKLRPGIQLGENIDDEIPGQAAGRIAAQTAKQVVLQRLREAERDVVFEEYSGRDGDIVSGEVLRMEGRNVIVDLGKAEALLPSPEQVRNEHYRSGQRMKFYVVEVYKATKGPQVVVSRTHKNLIRRLFELEVPEIFKGAVEMKAIAREPGYRSKVAVWSNQEGIDPVGACVGLRGLRIQNIVNELNGERIDVVLWDPEPTRFVAHALSPAQVLEVRADTETNTAEVVVPDRQLSLAIGKEGQNARLAAKLSGWRIDIKSQAAYDEYLDTLSPEEREALTAAKEATVPIEIELPEAKPMPAPAASGLRALTAEQEAVRAFQKQRAEEAAAAAERAGVDGEEPAAAEAEPEEMTMAQVRFAEEILQAEVEAKGGRRSRAKKPEADADDEGAKAAKPKRRRVYVDEEDEEEYTVH
jgi:transcription termination/antitermination protein NusA